jgi:hypothetical protein
MIRFEFILFILFFILLFFFYTVNNLLKKKEYFSNIDLSISYENNNNNNNNNNKKDEHRIIWMYWETLPNKTKPGYIDLCIESVKFNCKNCFNVIVLDNVSVYKYLPELKEIDLSHLVLPQKVDYYRYCLLEKYGGVWLDADILVIKCICPFFTKLQKHDYVGFGCGFKTSVCEKMKNPAYSRPLNWFMICKKNTSFIKCVKNKAHTKIMEYKKQNKKLPYHSIGKQILAECYEDLNVDGEKWDYHHVPSKCQEYDSQGNKLNNILIDFEWKDCEKERIFFPLYNTAPGYPDWFKKLSFQKLKESNLYIKPLIIQAFEKKKKCNENNYF